MAIKERQKKTRSGSKKGNPRPRLRYMCRMTPCATDWHRESAAADENEKGTASKGGKKGGGRDPPGPRYLDCRRHVYVCLPQEHPTT
eukprot:scaffold251530_cov24-Tisochrysis_lutea.AAC.1